MLRGGIFPREPGPAFPRTMAGILTFVSVGASVTALAKRVPMAFISCARIGVPVDSRDGPWTEATKEGCLFGEGVLEPWGVLLAGITRPRAQSGRANSIP